MKRHWLIGGLLVFLLCSSTAAMAHAEIAVGLWWKYLLKIAQEWKEVTLPTEEVSTVGKILWVKNNEVMLKLPEATEQGTTLEVIRTVQISETDVLQRPIARIILTESYGKLALAFAPPLWVHAPIKPGDAVQIVFRSTLAPSAPGGKSEESPSASSSAHVPSEKGSSLKNSSATSGQHLLDKDLSSKENTAFVVLTNGKNVYVDRVDLSPNTPVQIAKLNGTRGQARVAEILPNMSRLELESEIPLRRGEQVLILLPSQEKPSQRQPDAQKKNVTTER